MLVSSLFAFSQFLTTEAEVAPPAGISPVIYPSFPSSVVAFNLVKNIANPSNYA